MSSTRCSDNVATMSWVSKEVGELYTVRAISDDGLHFDSCSGFGQACELAMLKCGVPYTATVMAQDSVCTSPPSQAAPIRTGLCDSIMMCIVNGAETSAVVTHDKPELFLLLIARFSHVQCPAYRIM